ncbi:hypothetical protein L3X38_034484 [Prunus dulcis]|uniref:Uncharacterized protein n=1 Tax=Prunus dulcis TaxID=3755 RepID=A0AAD4VHX2_PRUDU|nr:hypothetical protein L3X38_034484 [Prunus dulcis]
MRKSGLTRGSPNLVILCLRKVVSLRKIKFLQKGHVRFFGREFGSPLMTRRCPAVRQVRLGETPLRPEVSLVLRGVKAETLRFLRLACRDASSSAPGVQRRFVFCTRRAAYVTIHWATRG